MQQPYLLRGSRCLAAEDKKSASVSVNKGKFGAVLDFDNVWPCSFINTRATVLPPRRPLEAKLFARVKRFLAIQTVGLVRDTGDK